MSRDSQQVPATARAQRLEDRNMNKDRSQSLDVDEAEDKKYFGTAGTSSDFATSWKPPASRTVPDSFAPPAFSGSNADADTWLAHFQRYTEYRQLPDEDVVAIFPLFLKDSAIDWYETLSRNVKVELKPLLENFKSYFGKSPLDYVFEQESVFTRAQRPKEKARDYIAQMQKLAKRIPNLAGDLLLWVILRGLRPQIKASVIQQKGDIKTVADILELAKLAESAGLGIEDDTSGDPRMNHLMDEVRAGRDEVHQLSARVAGMSVSSSQPRSPTPERRQARVSFQVPNEDARAQRYGGPQHFYGGGRGVPVQSRPYGAGPSRRFFGPGSGTQSRSPCDRCGRFHGNNRCPATNVSCFNCGKIGHLRARCRSARRGSMGISG